MFNINYADVTGF